MEEKQLLMLTNQKWKTYKIDKKTNDLIKSLDNIRKKNDEKNFIEWLNKNIKLYEDERDDEISLKVKDVLENLIYDINVIMKEKGREILNQKQLRDTVASMIYKES
jgi:hypothetical protein